MTWLVETLVASTLLLAIVLVLRRPVARLLGPHTAYLLWILPLARLLLPPIPGARIVDLPMAQAPTVTAPALVAMEATAEAPQSVALTSAFDWGLAVVGLWLAVAVLHMVCHIISYRRFIRRTVGPQPPLQIIDGIAVYGADVAGPAAAGIVRRRILLPCDFADRFDAHERRLALAHEVAHHRRGDLVANWLALAVLSLHWFNPLAHIAYRAFRADQELACDATVLGATSATERHAYASAVVKAAWTRSPVAACPMNSAGQIKARLAMMKAGGWSIQHRLTGLAIVSGLAVLGLAATATRTVAALPEALSASPSPPVATSGKSDSLHVLPGRDAGQAEEPVAESAAPAPAYGSDARAAEGELVATLVDTALQTASEPQVAPVAEPAMRPIEVSLAATPAPMAGSPMPSAEVSGADRQDTAPRPAPALLTADALKAAAKATTQQMRTPGSALFRDVRAVLVDGRYNAVEPGVPYVGFCGKMRILGSSDWQRFFISQTPSTIRGRAEKCATVISSEDYSVFFASVRSGGTTARRLNRNGCRADQSACVPSYYSQVARTNSVYPSADEFDRGTRVLP
jgi:beta-lactamase regulating signal transducer with metallopeptidase domain